MSFFLDSIDFEEIQTAMKLGIFSGVTTNPKLFANTARSELLDHVARIASISQGSIYVQVDLQDVEQMKRQALTMMEIAPGRIIIKCPISTQGLELCSALRPHRLPVCMTAVFSPLQAASAAAAGAHAVAVYTGRITDSGADGVDTVAQSAAILSATASNTKVLAASIRSHEVLVELLKIPSIDVTIPGSLIQSLWEHPLTTDAISEFAEAANSSKSLGDQDTDDESVLKMLEDDPI